MAIRPYITLNLEKMEIKEQKHIHHWAKKYNVQGKYVGYVCEQCGATRPR